MLPEANYEKDTVSDELLASHPLVSSHDADGPALFSRRAPSARWSTAAQEKTCWLGSVSTEQRKCFLSPSFF